MLAVIAGLRLDPDHPAAGRQRAGGERAAGEKAAAAERREHHVERADLLEQLLRGRALPGDHVHMVVRRDQGQAAGRGALTSDRLAILREAVVEHDLGAVAARRRHLHGRRVARHDDQDLDAQQLSGERHGLGVVAGRDR